ncbi:MAG: amidohydrolase family protein [Candidatus Binatia bacterium]|nr:amidohydrolase family protein [Candidatus Binatia bacterium]
MDPFRLSWLNQVTEPIVDPEAPIVDPHHHLWPVGGAMEYGIDDLRADTGSGHNVVGTVFVECRAVRRPGGPDHLQPVGETEFVAAEAARLRKVAPDAAPIAGIVGYADLRTGPLLAETLAAHGDAGAGLFRGIRHAGSHAIDPEAHSIPGSAPAGLYLDESFRDGVRELGRRGLTYDTWHFHYQNREFAELARAVPDTILVLDHFGTPLGVGKFTGRREEIFAAWKDDIADIARCENVVAKLGGLAMPDNGFGWNAAERPPTSDEFVAAQGRYYQHTIECFGPERCMFESNFPVDKLSLSYPVVWNAFKKIAARYSADERTAMFSRTATRTYRL